MGAPPDPPIDVSGPPILRDTFHTVSNFINGRCLIPIAPKKRFGEDEPTSGRVVDEI